MHEYFGRSEIERKKSLLDILREVAAKGFGVWRVEEMKERRKTF
jgi:hypothetical protein